MYRMRSWSVRNARWLNALYVGIETTLVAIAPLLRLIGHDRLQKPFVAVEKITKGFLLDSQTCGQCIVGSTGLSCPMNCPKSLRNGPCGGVRPDGKCEIGAHLNPWITPPLAEELTSTNTFPGNLCAVLERAKLTELTKGTAGP